MESVTTLANNVGKNLDKSGKMEEIGSKIAGSVSDYEDQLLKLYSSNDSGKNDAEIQATQIKYQRAMRTMQAFSEMMRNAHEMMMKIISNLRLN